VLDGNRKKAPQTGLGRNLASPRYGPRPRVFEAAFVTLIGGEAVSTVRGRDIRGGVLGRLVTPRKG
jgi:hypothetical protein